MPWIRLTAATALALFLAATHWKLYVAGQNSVRVQYQDAALKAEQAARAQEQALIQAKQKAEAAYVKEKQKAAAAAASADRALDGLRSALAERAAAADTATCTRVDAGVGLEQELLGHCAAALVGLAAEADRLEALVVGLQGYVKNVCTRK
jgi:leucyl aminopeptidase (aminopeptidase T)